MAYYKCPYCPELVKGHRLKTVCPKGNRVKIWDPKLKRSEYKYVDHIFDITEENKDKQKNIPKLMKKYTEHCEALDVIEKWAQNASSVDSFRVLSAAHYPLVANNRITALFPLFIVGSGCSWKKGNLIGGFPENRKNLIESYQTIYNTNSLESEHNIRQHNMVVELASNIDKFLNQEIKIVHEPKVKTFGKRTLSDDQVVFPWSKQEIKLFLPSNRDIDKKWEQVINEMFVKISECHSFFPTSIHDKQWQWDETTRTGNFYLNL